MNLSNNKAHALSTPQKCSRPIAVFPIPLGRGGVSSCCLLLKLLLQVLRRITVDNAG